MGGYLYNRSNDIWGVNGEDMKKEKNRIRTGNLWGLMFVSLLCVIVVLALLCLLCLKLKNEIRQNQQAIDEEQVYFTEKIEHLEAEIKVLNERIFKQETQQTASGQQIPAESEQIQEPELSSGTLEENAMIGPPANKTVSVDSMEIGQTVSAEQVIGKEENFFKAYEIMEGDAVYNRINGRSYYANDNIGLSDLRYLKMAHYNFEHQVQIGEMIVNAQISNDVLNIFKELFAAGYEIQSMRLIDDYWTGDGDSSDSNSIDNNNTSAFCYREITGGGRLSNHAFGRAIDINPQQNPYVWNSGGQLQWSHENATPYIDRTCGDPHVIVQNDICYNIFAKYGFGWGGLWSDPIDYQHFEKENQG